MAKSILLNPSKDGCQSFSYLHPGWAKAAKVAASHMFPLRLPINRFLTISPGGSSPHSIGIRRLCTWYQGFHRGEKAEMKTML